jgi:NAD-dependent deacetylase
MFEANKIAESAEVFIIIGTSLNVYPAAGIIDYVGPDCSIYLVDPKDIGVPVYRNLKHIKANAGEGVPELLKQWIPTS